MSSTADELPWLTISEAAERTGRKLDAMRALVRRGRLPRKKGNRGEWLVQIPGAVMRPALALPCHVRRWVLVRQWLEPVGASRRMPAFAGLEREPGGVVLEAYVEASEAAFGADV